MCSALCLLLSRGKSEQAGALYMPPSAIRVHVLILFTRGLAMGYLVFKVNNLGDASLYHAACSIVCCRVYGSFQTFCLIKNWAASNTLA